MKVNIPKDWCMEMARLEGDMEVGAGQLSSDALASGFVRASTEPSFAFSQVIDFLRREHELTPAQLAHRAHVDLADLLAIERNPDQTPHLRTVYQIARYFNLQVSLLMQLAGLTTPSDAGLADRAVRFAANSDPSAELSDEQQAILEALISELNQRP